MEPEPASGEAPASEDPTFGASRRAIDLVAAYGVAQWNVVQTRLLHLDAGQQVAAKTRQREAYAALMRYVATLERRRSGE